MEIYKVEQVTWNDGDMGEFNLSRCLGYFTTREKAENAKLAHIAERESCSDDEGWTTHEDYRIFVIQVL